MLAEGPAFPLLVRIVATVFAAGTVYWGVQARDKLFGPGADGQTQFLMGLALFLVLWCVVWLWRSRTTVSAERIHQSWMWTKQARWSEITQAKLIAVPHLEWLIGPRMVVRLRGGGVTVFQCADRQVLRLFADFTLHGRPPAAPDGQTGA